MQTSITTVPQKARWPGLILQPESSVVSEDQLTAEIKDIYAGLVMVEAKCVNIDTAQTSDSVFLDNEQWQALIVLHRALLYEHHDFLMATQHPSATPASSAVPVKYSMPARMWKHGIYALLETLRHRRPESQNYMLSFIYVAYQMTTLLHETVPVFLDTWVDCLGDLARYRMAIEEEREPHAQWGLVVASWYLKASRRHPQVGRLCHHLALLERPSLRKVACYGKSLTRVVPFANANDSLRTLATYNKSLASDVAVDTPSELSWTSYGCSAYEPEIKQWYGTEAAKHASVGRSFDRTTCTQRPLSEVEMMRQIKGSSSGKCSKLRWPSTQTLNREVQPCAHGGDVGIPTNFLDAFADSRLDISATEPERVTCADLSPLSESWSKGDSIDAVRSLRSDWLKWNPMKFWSMHGAGWVAGYYQRFRSPTGSWGPSSPPRLMTRSVPKRQSITSKVCKALTSVSAMQAAPAEHRPTAGERYRDPGGLDSIIGSLPYILLFLLALAFEALTARKWLHERFTLFNLFEAVLSIVAWPALVRTGIEAQPLIPFLQATILAIWFLMICAGARSLKFRSPQAFGLVAIVIGGMAYVAINLFDTPDASEHGAKRVRIIQAVKLYEHALVWLITMTIYGIFKIFICLSRRRKTCARRTTRSPNFPV
ncbi:hypothetical protein LTR86_009838 [Recurvomyces mirabilis]|nr:hypothetical protein LTR86_009838 [Recurvomyces mirabilis]